MSLALFSEDAFKNGIRYDAATKRFSVNDVVRIVTGCAPKHVSRNLDSALKILNNDTTNTGIKKFEYFQFLGRNQSPTPVADMITIVEIAFALPGRKAAEFRNAGANIFCRAFGGDLSLVEEIRKRHADVAWTEKQEAFLEGTGVSLEEANAPRNSFLDADNAKLENARKALELYDALCSRAENEGDERVKRALLDRALSVLQVEPPPSRAKPEALPAPETSPEPRNAWMTKEIPRKKSAGASPRMVEAFLESGWLQFGEEKYMPFANFKNMFGAFANENGYAGPKNVTRDSTDKPFRERGLYVERTFKRYEGKRTTADFLMGVDMYRPPESQPPYSTRSSTKM